MDFWLTNKPAENVGARALRRHGFRYMRPVALRMIEALLATTGTLLSSSLLRLAPHADRRPCLSTRVVYLFVGRSIFRLPVFFCGETAEATHGSR